MSQVSFDEERVKELFKQALRELLQEQRELLYDVFTEALEDMALVNAIQEGEAEDSISRDEVFAILEA